MITCIFLKRWDSATKYTDGEAFIYADYQFPTVPVPPPAIEARINRKKYI